MRLDLEGLPSSCRGKGGSGLFIHIRFCPVTSSTFAVVCWSVVKGAGYCLAVTAFHYETYCGPCTVLT